MQNSCSPYYILYNLTYVFNIVLQSNQWTTLISNTGGNLGLFVGMSIITLLELADYLIDVLLILISPSLYHYSHCLRRGKKVDNDNKSSMSPTKNAFQHPRKGYCIMSLLLNYRNVVCILYLILTIV